jgi:hypothetical protein
MYKYNINMYVDIIYKDSVSAHPGVKGSKK